MSKLLQDIYDSVEAYRSNAEQQLNTWTDHANTLRDRNNDLEDLNADLLEALEGVEWNGYDNYAGESCCPACYKSQHDGHEEDCYLSAAIRKAK